MSFDPTQPGMRPETEPAHGALHAPAEGPRRLRLASAERDRAEEERDLFFSVSLDMLCLASMDGYFTHLNPVWERTLGWTREELMARPYLDFIHPDDQAATIAEATKLREPSSITVSFENRYRTRDGSYRWLQWSARPIPNSQVICASARDVTDRKEAEEDLRRAKEAAEIANEAKSRFLAHVSHELRTPLSGILGMIEMTQATDLTADQREYLAMARSSAESLLGVINDLLDFSKIEAGRLELARVPFKLCLIVGEVIKSLAPRARQKGLDLESTVEPNVPLTLEGDPRRLRQILLNLVGNAIKFTEHGEVAVHVKLDRNDLQVDDGPITLAFEVRDTGIGVPLEKQASIFDAFVQADTSTSRKYGGTGLGLSIASRLVELMGGRIGLTSAPGQGSTFSFTARFTARQSSKESSTPLDLGGFDDMSEAKEIVAKPSLRVLLAEDNPVNQALGALLLQKLGHDVEIAANGQQALAAYRQRSFDLILLDLQMPELDGISTATSIRQEERVTGGHVPIVAVTAYALKGDRERCLEAGMDGYLAKPFRVGELARTIDELRITPGAPIGALPKRGDLLRHFGGKEDRLKTIIELFRHESAQALADIRAALDRNDAATVQQRAHSLVGALAIVRANSTLEKAGQIESQARADSLAQIAPRLGELEREIAAINHDLASDAVSASPASITKNPSVSSAPG